ncbi:MAG TPA: GlsB/YeaQ/YmgE family stress response membrane protein [Candidatus Limnocylindria bacterium]|nr:GlsB/YeaQ/YmgE family stress response membrane protein [Candidatus Limnocylindria bacterium]
MLNVVFWIVAGALSGWIGRLATRTNENEHLIPYLAVGIAGGLLGGFIAQSLGGGTNSGSLNPESILNALFMSAVVVTGFVAFLSFFRNTHSGGPPT